MIEPVCSRQSALRDTLRWQWNLSTRPLDCGWKDVVGEWMIPRNLQRLVQIELVNYAPWSEVITDRTPKVWIQDRSKALAHFSAVVDWRGITFGHPLVLSTMVNKKVCPQDWGRGPTRSMWIWENLRPGTGICWMGDFLWVWALLRWQFRQDWDHKFTSLDSPSQTKLLEINLLDAHKPGWEILWINSTPSFSSSPEPGGGGYQWTCHRGGWNLSREQK